jgi:hypothetical protein
MFKFDLEHLKSIAAFSVQRENAHQGDLTRRARLVGYQGWPARLIMMAAQEPAGSGSRQAQLQEQWPEKVGEARLRAHGDRLGR